MSIQPISSAAMSALIWEIDPTGAESLYGPTPIGADGSSSSSGDIGVPNGRLGSVLSALRTRYLPAIIASMNQSEVTLVRRTKSYSAGSLSSTWSYTTEAVYAVISGPSEKSLENGLLGVDDYEVLIPANSASILDQTDAIRIDGADYDIVRIQHHPHTPPAVAYKYLVKRNR